MVCSLLTLAGVVDVHGPRGDEVDWRGGGVGAVHVSDQPRKPELPLGVGILLKGGEEVLARIKWDMQNWRQNCGGSKLTETYEETS